MGERGHDEGSEGHPAIVARGKERSGGIVVAFLGALRASARWWLAPTIVVLLLIVLALLLGGTAAGPFIYNVF